MNETDEKEDELSCSFCKEKFSDVVKLIRDCANNICEKCHENLKVDVDKKTNKYECVACGERHTLPPSGLRDNKGLMVAIREIKKTEKLMHPNIKKLKELVKKVEDKMEKLRTFDEKELIKSYCEKIELDASEAIKKAINHLEEIERKMMRQISEYRERCLENLSMKLAEPENTVKQELKNVTKEITEYNARWNNYFGRIEAHESEDEIKAALDKTEEYMSALDSMEEQMRKEALNWETMVFKDKLQFLEEWNHVGEFEIIAEPKPPNRRGETAESPNPVNSTPPKKMTIQQTPSFTLTGHSHAVRQVLFLPDGRLASCSSDATIKIWDGKNGKELFQLKGHTNWVLSIALLPNGHLASGSRDKTIKIWDLEQRKEIRSIEAHSNTVITLRVLKNGNLASYSLDDTIKIWNLNLKENEPFSTLRGHGYTFFWWAELFGIISNDFLVTWSRHKETKEECILRVWNPNEPNPIKSVPTGFNDAWSLLVLSNDQVALGFSSGTIKIIDLNDDALSRTKERAHHRWVTSLAQLSNGNLISAGIDDSNYTIKVWNLIDFSLLQIINPGHSYSIQSLSISSDERILASGSDDNTIKLWPISME